MANPSEHAGEPVVWVLLDTVAGHRNQALGVADALGLPFQEKKLSYGMLGELPNRLLGATFSTLRPHVRKALKQESWPDLVIAAGRRTSPVARAIRKASKGKARLVQVMDPGSGHADFSLIALPTHDATKPGANMLEITGAPHRVTPQALADARETWRGELERIASPRIAVILGGNTRRRLFTRDMGYDMAEQVRSYAEGIGGRLMITTSRRSGHGGAAFVGKVRDLAAHMFLWGDKGDNPYLGYLAWADQIIVTGESVSMCSEACGVGTPVHLFAPRALITRKHARMLQGLCDDGYAQPLGGSVAPTSHSQLNPAGDIADAIRDRVLT